MTRLSNHVQVQIYNFATLRHVTHPDISDVVDIDHLVWREIESTRRILDAQQFYGIELT